MGKTLLDPLRAVLRNAAANPPVPYASTRGGRLGGILGRPAGMEAQMRAQGTNGTLFAIVDRTCTSYSQVEWRLYRKARSGLKNDRTEVTAHAALDLWHAPNPFMTGPAFREAAQQHEELTGEQRWVISRHAASSLPLELWPVRPDRIEPIPSATEFLSGYEYRGPGGEVVPLGLDDVISMLRPNPLDPYRGLGPVQTVLVDLDASRYSREWNRNFFVSSAEPGGVLQVEKRLDDDEFDELRARWNEQHRGVAAAHRVAILENGIQWVDRKYTNRDMQFAELSQVSDEKIRGAFGFPKPLLGAVDDVNRANADAAEVVFARWLLVPRLERTKAALNTRLLPMYGPSARDLEWDYVSPVPEDADAEAARLTSKAEAVQSLIAAGVYGPDALAAVGLPEMEFGQPGSDPDRELLIRLVTGAPSLAPLILPMLGFQLPAEPGTPATTPAQAAWQRAVAGITGGSDVPDVDDALRWIAVSEHDDDVCQPCADNDGALYKNRADAYADYPGGSGYIHCIGAQYGNECRCKVVKRGKEDS
ncbi:phage portal protein [Streptomyces sp. NRRL F-5123]|uniref:phage portal protein n=1 Tax=Streptomyces sp. NRRL F-5123 TaxID=1463856 RepID=UPI0004E11B46|nr:phage portal protein [Streptomyces sp. NRRL F-5123]